MHADWHKFLQQQGTVFDDGLVTRFEANATAVNVAGDGVALADLSGIEGLIAVTGPERHEFLQGQLSTDIRRLTPALSQFSSWNNAKGRVVSTLHVSEHDDTLLLTLPRELLASILSGLRLHVLRSKVTLTDISDRLTEFGVAGKQAPRLLQECACRAPEANGGVTSNQGVQVMRLHGVLPRFAVYGEVAGAQALWARLRGRGAHPVDSDAWTLQRILAGEPRIHPATSGHFVAQMLDLEELGAVHFNKGCYLGQEIIARAHYRGTIKRHLHRASCQSTNNVIPGMEIMDAMRSAAAGEVVDACRDHDGDWQLLVVLHAESADAPLHIDSAPVSLIS